MDGLSQIFTAKAWICAITHVGQSDWVTAAARIFSWSHWYLELPYPCSNLCLSPGTPCSRATGLGSILGTWGSSVGTEGWHRPSGARLALSLASDHPPPSSSLPPRVWGGEQKGDRSVDLDNGNLIRQAPAVCASRARGGIHSLFPSTGGFSGTGTSSARAVVAQKDKFQKHGCVPCPFSFLPVDFVTQYNVMTPVIRSVP